MTWKLGLTFYSNQIFTINPLQFKMKEFKKFMRNSNFHLYIICKRKKLFFDSCSDANSRFNETRFYLLNDKHEKEYIPVKHSKDIFIHKSVNDKYILDFKEHKNIEFDGYTVINFLFHRTDDMIGDKEKNPIPSDLEVLYIGQSYGRNKRRQIDKRLTNHEKLQKIALDIIQKGTSEEVLVIGLNYSVKDLATAVVSVDTDRSHFNLENLLKLKNNAAKRIPESQEITVFEAALINYFQTDLNIEYREKFPSLGYSSYEEIYKTNFDYASMEINTYEARARIYSQKTPERKYHHLKQFALNSNDQKKDFFEYLFSE
jgi:hypothetical protein